MKRILLRGATAALVVGYTFLLYACCCCGPPSVPQVGTLNHRAAMLEVPSDAQVAKADTVRY